MFNNAYRGVLHFYFTVVFSNHRTSLNSTTFLNILLRVCPHVCAHTSLNSSFKRETHFRPRLIQSGLLMNGSGKSKGVS